METSINQVRENAHRPELRRTQVRTEAHQKEMRAREMRRERKIAKAKRQTRIPAKVTEETAAGHRAVTKPHHTGVESHLIGLRKETEMDRSGHYPNEVLANHLPEVLQISPNRRGVLLTQ